MFQMAHSCLEVYFGMKGYPEHSVLAKAEYAA